MNEEQLKAIKTLDDTLLIAGAGTGKSTTIINKINYLIENEGYKKKDLLIISFTNETVKDLKNKLKYDVDVFTFHKLALNIINDDNIQIANDYLLKFIINEYFESYAKYNFKIRIKIKRLLLENNYANLIKIIMTFINLYKSNYKNIDLLVNLYKQSHFIMKDYYYVILQIYLIYLRELEGSLKLDFNDLITNATKLVNCNQKKTKYKYIIVDEFQDSSLIRLKLLLAIKEQNKAKIFFVGDDCQSIYRFSGCNLDVFLKIKDYLPNIKILKLKINYRNNQETINIANNFVWQNKKQIRKDAICLKKMDKPIVIVYYKKKIQLDKLIDSITGKILILGRNNIDKENFFVKENERIKFLTVHKAKGLEDDNVIIINLENCNLGFPSQIKCPPIYNHIILKDEYLFEEERRLFYVALTRSKNKTYLFVPISNPSIFVKEIIKNYYNKLDFLTFY